jgi:hypothetical protein
MHKPNLNPDLPKWGRGSVLWSGDNPKISSIMFLDSYLGKLFGIWSPLLLYHRLVFPCKGGISYDKMVKVGVK